MKTFSRVNGFTLYDSLGFDFFSTSEFSKYGNLATTKQSQTRFSHPENTFENAPVRRIPTAMNTNSAFTGSYTENQFCYYGIGLRQIRKLTVGQHNVTFDAFDFCRLYVTTMKAKTFQGYISILLDKFEDHYLIMFDLTSMTVVTDKSIWPRTSWRTTEAPADFYFSS